VLKHLIPLSDSPGVSTEKDEVSGRDPTDRWRAHRQAGQGLGLATDPLTYTTSGSGCALTPGERGAGEGRARPGALMGHGCGAERVHVLRRFHTHTSPIVYGMSSLIIVFSPGYLFHVQYMYKYPHRQYPRGTPPIPPERPTSADSGR
jgi:hypothetical protein